MIEVWVLDWVGYDARGGNAEVYASLEAAKASLPNEPWPDEPDNEGFYESPVDYGTPGSPVIYRREVQG